MSRRDHWENIYTSKEITGVSWFREHLESSLQLIESAGLRSDARIIDVGGGASTLVDDLLERGFTHLTMVDISATALEKIKHRLGERAASVS
jgi:16S rRNA A1518/A1519 N6-dimethyltransferase RsmA/KsgA/DIM1 with predicted DNA glycosylase/AP lyase activity